ncbi:monooxygenase 2-like [Nymphaea colorata]|nr:monooxygenase 2-like [Nymphaea colorata]
MEIEEEVVIVGAGIAGLATAIALRKVGLSCLVLERSTELRTAGAALALFPNAWRALRELGVADKLTPHYPAVEKASVTSVSSGQTRQLSLARIKSSDGLGIRLVHRKALLKALAEELPPAVIRFSSKPTSIGTSPDSSLAILHLEDGTIVKARVLIGCDGVRSMVAPWLGLLQPVHSGRSAVRSIGVFPDGHGFEHELQQVLGQGIRAGFLPLSDKEIFWFLTFKTPKEDLDIGKYPELVQEYVLQKLVKDFPEKYKEVVRKSDLASTTLAPLMFRWPWNLFSGQVSKGNVTVAGDAMHPMTPDIAQGGCSALEDAVVLARNLGEALQKDGKIEFDKNAIEEGLKKYVKERRLRTAGLITGAFLSGWIQGNPVWLVRMIRDNIFYPYLFPKILNAIDYDCGKLPAISSRN